jgi:HD-GYP domain-containing protein (c-di-GMP phosphodiesterase class II)
MSPEGARQELRGNAGSQFDPTVEEAFLRTLSASAARDLASV